MKERPILFSAPMVRAILNGSKTQTRRFIKPQPEVWDDDGVMYARIKYGRQTHSGPGDYLIKDILPEYGCPYGKPGDRLWVRETFALWKNSDGQHGIDYRATPTCNVIDRGWKPSIHMPRNASRINLEITGVRVERLQDISKEDVMAEGFTDFMTEMHCGYHQPYADLWEKINGAGSWSENPWVWVVEFKRATS